MQVDASRTSAAQIYLWTWQVTGQSRARPDRLVRGVDGRTHRASSAYARRAPAVAADQPVCQPRLPGVGRRGGGASGAGQFVPFLEARLHLASLPLSVWLVAVGAALVLPSWWEPWKWSRIYLGKVDSTAGAP